MRTALHLANQPLVESDAYDLGQLKPVGEPSHIWRLQAEINALRAELARAERAVWLKEVLLQNAMVRERALRMELTKGN